MVVGVYQTFWQPVIPPLIRHIRKCSRGSSCLSLATVSLITLCVVLSSHRGCKCPEEFHGPHCEFLKFIGNEQEEGEPKGNVVDPVQSRFMAVMLTLMSLSAVMLMALVAYKLKSRQVPREITVPPTFLRGYDESRYNGRHLSYSNQNLHIHTVFEDVVIS